MSEDLFQLIALGMLVVLVLVSVVIAAQLARIRGSLRPGAPAPEPEAGEEAPEPEAQEEAPGAVEPSSNGESESVPGFAQGSEQAPVEEPVAEPQEAEDAGARASAEPGQPYERDGRWWFERDGELLVYDDRSGQWIPAETETTGIVAVTPSPEELVHPLDEPRPEDAPAATMEQPAVEEEPQPVASFWKCPSCGVVNGSTAHTCRMCFSARP